jgi:predicted nucleic acid-binding protein
VIVVSDTTAITSLIAIDRADLLRQVFGEVFIPRAVLSELHVVHATVPEFLQIREVIDGNAVRQLKVAELDDGEAEAIVLAEELAADYLLIDESDGRAIAKQRGLRIIGLIGVLLRAKNEELVSKIAPILEALTTNGGFWISEQIRNQALADAGELTK